MRTKNKQIEIYDVYVNGRPVDLKEPLIVNIERCRDGTYILENPELGLCSTHRNITKAIDLIKRDFDILWGIYASCNSSLPERKAMKEKLKRLLE